MPGHSIPGPYFRLSASWTTSSPSTTHYPTPCVVCSLSERCETASVPIGTPLQAVPWSILSSPLTLFFRGPQGPTEAHPVGNPQALTAAGALPFPARTQPLRDRTLGIPVTQHWWGPVDGSRSVSQSNMDPGSLPAPSQEGTVVDGIPWRKRNQGTSSSWTSKSCTREQRAQTRCFIRDIENKPEIEAIASSPHTYT